MRLRFNRVILLFFILSLAALLMACDSWLDVKGNVYEWVDAPVGEKGQIYITEIPTAELSASERSLILNEVPPEGLQLQPVSDATVRFYQGFSLVHDSGATPKDAVLQSDFGGSFKGFWIVGPGNRKYKIVVEKDGYYRLEKVFPFYGGIPMDFVFTVIMVRKP